MTHYQYPQQPWTERAQTGTRAVQSARPTGVSQPVRETQATGRLAQQPNFVGSTVEAETPEPSSQETAQFVSQPTQQAGSFSPPQFEPRQEQGFTQPTAQPQQVAAPKPQQLVQPVARPQVQPRQVEALDAGRLARPAVSTQLPARTEWAQQLPARTGLVQPPVESVQPAEQPVGMQAAGGTAPSGVQAGGGGTAGQAKPAGGEQAMAAAPESQTEQQAQVTSLTKGMPSIDIYETPDDVIVFADVPGCTPDDIDLLGNESSITLVANRGEPSVSNGKSIQRERVEEVERTIALPARAEIDEAEASVDDGVCRVTLPKSEDDRAKRIGIQ